jgi:hypothetical protein
VAFKTNNTIKHHIKIRDSTIDVYNLSGVYQMECKGCPPKQTFRTRHNEHIKEIRKNGQFSKFGQHIFDTAHKYDNMEQTMKIIHVERKGQMLNTSENYYILITKQSLQMNEAVTGTYNPIYDILIEANPNVHNPTYSRILYQPPHHSTLRKPSIPLCPYSSPPHIL